MFKKVDQYNSPKSGKTAHPVTQNKRDRSKVFSFMDNRAESMSVNFFGGNNEDINYNISPGIVQRVAKRRFSDAFSRKHIRDASEFNSYHAMVEEAVDVMSGRSKQQNISGSSLIFMTAYQQALFCEQKHNEWQGGYASTTQFPIVEVSSSGKITIYSAAQFGYSGYDRGGVYEIYHYIPDSAYGHIDYAGSYSDLKK